MDGFLYSARVLLPIFFIVFLGIISKKLGLINKSFISTSSQVVFFIAMPSSIFCSIYKMDFFGVFQGKIIFISWGATLAVFLFSWWLSRIVCQQPSQEGAFVQASFRGNLAIFGLAVVDRAFSANAMGLTASLLAFLIPTYNFLAVVALTGGEQQGSRKEHIKSTCKKIATNPLILAIVLGLIFSLTSLPLPHLMEVSLSYLSQMTIPLALLGIGGSLQVHQFRARKIPVFVASAIKLVFMPVLVTLVAYWAGIKGEPLAVMFILAGCPVAVSSFAMADSLKGDAGLSADIITLTTLMSIVTIGSGLALLRELGGI
ncbi:MAG: AEC family transporter [Desulfovibrio sp.]|uniref:AEC family transporter n=1 Tax=Desulfovibrio sp. 7SRBS1 TaxID=3378064 RepID=UPI003B41512C